MRRKWSNELAPRFPTSCRHSKFNLTPNDLGSFPGQGDLVGPDKPDRMLTWATREMTGTNMAPAFLQSISSPAACIIYSKYLVITRLWCRDPESGLSLFQPCVRGTSLAEAGVPAWIQSFPEGRFRLRVMTASLLRSSAHVAHGCSRWPFKQTNSEHITLKSPPHPELGQWKP